MTNGDFLLAAEEQTNTFEGAGIFESFQGMMEANNQWALNGNTAAAALGALGAVMDPLQSIFSAGVGWLMEHVSFLREPLDALMGDPKAIDSHAASWRNIQAHIYQATDEFAHEVNKSTAAWAAASADAYRNLAREHAESTRALGQIADNLSVLTTSIGATVGVVRNTVRDIVADVIGACISKALQAATVVLIPKVVTEVAILVSKTIARIFNVLEGLLARLQELGKAANLLVSCLEMVGQVNRKVTLEVNTRTEVAGTGDISFSAFKDAYKQLPGQGQDTAYGTPSELASPSAKLYNQQGNIDSTALSASSNALQNAGSVGATLTEDDEYRPVEIKP
ncbi:hypothetical protein [Salinispora vitiensis]|uniref:hypothetical protein n=1 Tax=Salinispora vitiensis TaxID=999544 RepID=UPI000369045A|nr:hypothetical protein [Salinispora vitiensis]